MKGKAKRRTPEIVLKEGKPAAVILDIDEIEKCWSAWRTLRI